MSKVADQPRRTTISVLAPPLAFAPSAQQPRTVGTALLSSKLRDGLSVLDDFRLSGACRMLFPRRRDGVLEAVMLNTSGGITGGDTISTQITAAAHTNLTLTSQAAERAYRSIDAQPGRIRTQIDLHSGARLDWLPQETILFDGCALDRALDIDLAPDARLLMVEPMIFGRIAMGETIRQAHLTDRITLRRAGQVIFADRVTFSGDVQAHLDRAAIAGGARAMASILIADPMAQTHLATLRDMLPPTCGASLIHDGLLFARLLAADGHALRQILIPVLRALRGADLPRTWML